MCIRDRAIIVPHAGYIYSGSTAALAYELLLAARQRISRVVLLGPVHRVPVRGLALPGADAFVTPLGSVDIDQQAVAAIAPLRQVAVSYTHLDVYKRQAPMLLIKMRSGDSSRNSTSTRLSGGAASQAFLTRF